MNHAFRHVRVSVALVASLGVAAPALSDVPATSFPEMVKTLPLVPAGTHGSEMLDKVTQAVGFIQRMALPQAHRAVNEALQLDPRNSHLHFLNGFVYHLQAKQGDTQKAEVAIEGYRQALRIDPGNWIAQEFLGLAYMDVKQFEQAKLQFTEVLLLTPESTVSMDGLMVASYLTGDASTACAMADQYQKRVAAPSPGFIRSSVAVYASCGQFDQADRMLATLATQGNTLDAQRMERRLMQWKSFHQRHAPGAGLLKTGLAPLPSADLTAQQLAQAFTLPKSGNAPASTTAPTSASSTAPKTPAADTPEAAAPSTPAEARPSTTREGPRMILIDVVLLSTQELVSTSKGVNLLSALTMQLGSVAGNVSAYSRVTTSNQNHGAPADVSTAITRAVTVPALSYSLNIANANNSVNEVLARPTLAAIEGMPSEFFSGTNLSAGVVSTSTQGGTTIVPLDKRFGIKLAVTPAFLPDGQVQIKVDAQRTSLNASSDNPRVAYQIEIAEINASANVVMNLGDTLVLSGLSEKSSSSTRDGVPVLQDVPVMQYLFSNHKTNQVQRSVLILVTPRVSAQLAEAPREGTDTAATRMQSLREQFGLPTTIPSNVNAILNQLQPEAFFREFRQADVSLERWDRMRSTGDRLQEALRFLYY